MPRTGLVSGNGYKCDICGQLIEPHNVYRVKCVKTIGHTGEMRTIDSIGVCEDCYKKEFPHLYDKGLLRTKIKGREVGMRE